MPQPSIVRWMGAKSPCTALCSNKWFMEFMLTLLADLPTMKPPFAGSLMANLLQVFPVYSYIIPIWLQLDQTFAAKSPKKKKVMASCATIKRHGISKGRLVIPMLLWFRTRWVYEPLNLCWSGNSLKRFANLKNPMLEDAYPHPKHHFAAMLLGIMQDFMASLFLTMVKLYTCICMHIYIYVHR